MATFEETEDSITESSAVIVDMTWDELKRLPGMNRIRKGMLRAALEHWVEFGYVVVPDDYREDEA
jgi:hypothetical protein